MSFPKLNTGNLPTRAPSPLSSPQGEWVRLSSPKNASPQRLNESLKKFLLFCIFCAAGVVVTVLLGNASCESSSWHYEKLNSFLSNSPVTPRLASAKYTVVINAFRRDDKAEQSFRSFAEQASCTGIVGLCASRIDRVILIWNDFERAVPEPIIAIQNQYPHIAYVQKSSSSSLSNRFVLWPSIRTDAIFTTDDDVYYSRRAMEQAFDYWLEHQDAAVGFAPRLMVRTMGSYAYSWDAAYHKKWYNIIFVTKGGFLHRKFHNLYFSDTRFDLVRSMVDEYTTAEDILMAFIHALHAGPGNVKAIDIPDETDFIEFHSFKTAKQASESGPTGKTKIINGAPLSSTTSKSRPKVMQALYKALVELDRVDILEKDESAGWCVYERASLRSKRWACERPRKGKILV